MRLAYLSCDFGVPVFGTSGSSVHVRETVRALRALGHEVEVFSPSDGAETGGADRDGFSILPLNGFAGESLGLLAEEITGESAHLVNEWRRLLYSEYIQRALLPTLAALQPHVIYERYSLFSYAGIELARQLRVPLLLEVNAPLSQEAARHGQLILRRTATEMERTILQSAGALFVVSAALEDHARRLGVAAERVHLAPNGVDPQRFHPGVSGDDVRAHYNLRGKRVIGFVGTLKPWHDLDTLLAATKLLAATDDTVHLLIVGDGPRLPALQALGAPYLTCTGAVEHDRIPAHLAAMDVVAVPYGPQDDLYFSPIKLFEAMAMAKPVVGARAGQVAETLVEGDTGLLYTPGDAAGLARRVRDVFALPDRGASLGGAARRWVLANRTWQQNAERIVAVAEALLEKSRA